MANVQLMTMVSDFHAVKKPKLETTIRNSPTPRFSVQKLCVLGSSVALVIMTTESCADWKQRGLSTIASFRCLIENNSICSRDFLISSAFHISRSTMSALKTHFGVINGFRL